MRHFFAAICGIAVLILANHAHGTAGWIEPNHGQAAPTYDFVVRAHDLTALVAPDHVALRLPAPGPALALPDHFVEERTLAEHPRPLQYFSLRMELLGAAEAPMAQRGARLHGVSRYLRGRDAHNWRTPVPHLEGMRYRNVYPGIDVVYRINQGQFEYDFEVTPGADPQLIRLRLAGTDKFAITPEGQWVAHTPVGVLRQRAPVIFRVTDGERVQIDGHFQPYSDNTVGFALSAGVSPDLVIIDPVIEFSGYVGGSGTDAGSRLHQNAQGDYILLGTTSSVDLPTAGAGALSGDQDVFVAQIDSATGAVNWVTYVGGSAYDQADNMQLDSAGNIVVVGYTSSDDYPTVNAFQSVFAGSEDPLSSFFNWDATVFKLSADGSALVFSTYLGGIDLNSVDAPFKLGFEWLRGVAIDASDNIYVAGQTAAPDFPVTQVFQGRACMATDINSQISFVSDIVVAKFAADGTRLVSMCIGGTERDGGRDVQLGADGSVYIAGFGRSGDLPGTAGFFQPSPIQPLTYSPFVIKLAPDLMSSMFATYAGEGILQRVAVDAAGNVYGAGSAYTDLYPVTPGAFQTTFVGGDPVTESGSDAFVFKLNASGATLDYATYLGGARDDDLGTVAIDGAGRAYLVGSTFSPDFPLQKPIMNSLGPVLGSVETTNAMTNAQALMSNYDPFNTTGTRVFFVARNGINRWYPSTPVYGAPATDMGLENADSRAVVMFDADLDGNIERVLFANANAPQHTYEWVQAAGTYVRNTDFGAANGDSRAAAVLLGNVGTFSDVVVANYGQPNEITFNGNPTPVAVGRPDGNTTSVAAGTFDLAGVGGQSIVFGNDGQDVRVLPYLGGGAVGADIVVASGGTAVSAVAAGDIDGDGLDELVIGNRDAPNQLVRFVAGSPVLPVDIGTDNDETLSLLLMDVDLDGDLDLLVGNVAGDRLYLNDGSGALTRDDSYVGNPDETYAVIQQMQCGNCEPPYLVTPAGVRVVNSARRSVFATVLNATGSALEFSTLLDGAGSDYVFRGLTLDGSGRMLIAGSTDGDNWPQIGRAANYAGQGDAMVMVLNIDVDADGVLDGSDNCTEVANPDQRDTNGDGYGNICDADLDNDGNTNATDLGIFRSVFLSADADADFNGDGVVNVQDLGRMRLMFFAPPGPSGLAP